MSLLQVPLVWVGQQMVSAQISIMTGQRFMLLCALVYHSTPALFSSLESSKKGMELMLKHAEKGVIFEDSNSGGGCRWDGCQALLFHVLLYPYIRPTGNLLEWRLQHTVTLHDL